MGALKCGGFEMGETALVRNMLYYNHPWRKRFKPNQNESRQKHYQDKDIIEYLYKNLLFTSSIILKITNLFVSHLNILFIP